MHLVSLPVAIALLPFAISLPEVSATPGIQLGGGVDLTASVGVSVGSDDNALLGRRGQFLDSPLVAGDLVAGDGEGRVSDLATRQRVGLGLSRRLSKEQLLRLAARGELALLRQQADLRGYDVAAAADYVLGHEADGEIGTSLAVLYHRDAPEWSYRTLQPQLRARKLFDFGLGSELSYQFSQQDFARDASGEAQPKNSYGNIDVVSHSAELALRMWHGRRVRSNLVGNFQLANYRGNLSTNLEDYAGLPPGEDRQDVGSGATASLLFVLLPRLVVTPTARLEHSSSNSKPYTFWAAHAGIDGLWEPVAQHSIYGQFDYARFDFPKERFDRRFTNTRRDFRSELRVAYRYRPAAGLQLDLAYRRTDSVSNDCAKFDPRRDEFGLPVNSRSYSCFAQNLAELALTYEIGGRDS